MAISESQEAAAGERITLDGIKPEVFDKLVTVLVRWISQGKVKVRLGRPAEIGFVFVEDEIAEELRKNSLPAACVAQLRMDIPIMLSGSLAGRRNVVARFLVEHSKPPKAKGVQQPSNEQIRQEIGARIKLVEDNIATVGVRREYYVRRTAKTSTYLGVSWDVVEKQSESVGNPPPKSVYATVRLTAHKPSSSSEDIAIFGSLYPPLFHGDETEDMVLTMNLRDIQDLVENLNKAADAVSTALGAEGGG